MSVSTLVLTVIMLGGTFGFMFFMKSKMSAQYAHMRAGDVATRLGMRMVEGDPSFNLVMQSVQPGVQNVSSAGGFLHQMAATSVGGTLGETRLRATGEVYGLGSELVLYCRQDFEPGAFENVTTTWHDLRLTVYTRGALAPFDLRLRQETPCLETRRDCTKPRMLGRAVAQAMHACDPARMLGRAVAQAMHACDPARMLGRAVAQAMHACDPARMPAQGFGVPHLDARFLLECFDPSLPRRIAAAIALVPAHAVYVHVTGEGNAISFVMTPASVSAAAMSLEPMLHVLASIASLLEGRAMPVARSSEAPRLAA
ncbi:MAG: hypothetical protein JST00_21425 [Deltaproteobacteria bacterium]|nr:hypothetical protein [Deltaproteobacteria bacterium]